METTEQPKWTWIREINETDDTKNIDAKTGWRYTPLEKYLEVIFPEITDWVHDKQLHGVPLRCRPDFRSESLKMVIEFDGIQHYSNPKVIIKDRLKDEAYKTAGYKVVRIPYFIQLTNDAVKELFGREVDEPLFNPELPSLFVDMENTPAYLCPAGVVRMAEEFSRFPDQCKVNVESLKAENNPALTGVDLLERIVAKLSKH